MDAAWQFEIFFFCICESHGLKWNLTPSLPLQAGEGHCRWPKGVWTRGQLHSPPLLHPGLGTRGCRGGRISGDSHFYTSSSFWSHPFPFLCKELGSRVEWWENRIGEENRARHRMEPADHGQLFLLSSLPSSSPHSYRILLSISISSAKFPNFPPFNYPTLGVMVRFSVKKQKDPWRAIRFAWMVENLEVTVTLAAGPKCQYFKFWYTS